MSTQPKVDGRKYCTGINLNGAFYNESANLSFEMILIVFLEGE